jgi:hypothetical protein
VIDLGFAIEPREESTLPEAVLGTVRLSRIEVGRPAVIAAEPGDSILGKPGEFFHAAASTSSPGHAGHHGSSTTDAAGRRGSRDD